MSADDLFDVEEQVLVDWLRDFPDDSHKRCVNLIERQQRQIEALKKLLRDFQVELTESAWITNTIDPVTGKTREKTLIEQRIAEIEAME